MEPTPATTRLLRPRELAAALGVSRETVRRLQNAGRIEAIYVGINSPRYDYEDVVRLLRETGPTTA